MRMGERAKAEGEGVVLVGAARLAVGRVGRTPALADGLEEAVVDEGDVEALHVPRLQEPRSCPPNRLA